VTTAIPSIIAISSASNGGWRADLRAQMHPPQASPPCSTPWERRCRIPSARTRCC
jgi:hypothetical protein